MYEDVNDLPWNNEVENNTFSIDDVSNGYSKGVERDPQIYRFTGDPDKLMHGKGILIMQKLLAFVFRHARYETVYKPMYIDNAESREALCSGFYGPITMEAVMIFQKLYMEYFFKNDWNPSTGFGMFGQNTYKTLFETHRRLMVEKKQQYLSTTNTNYKF